MRTTLDASAALLTLACLLGSGCAPDLEEGRDCSETSGYTCKEGYACVQGSCRELLGPGDTCQVGTAGIGSIPCDEGLVCRETDGDRFACQASANVGVSCLLNTDCEGALVCRRRSPSTGTTCEQAAAFGAFCEASDDCELSLRCIAGSDAMRSCGAPASSGEPCSFDECADGLSCVSGTCS